MFLVSNESLNAVHRHLFQVGITSAIDTKQKRWTTAKKLIEDARRRNEIVPLRFAPAHGLFGEVVSEPGPGLAVICRRRYMCTPNRICPEFMQIKWPKCSSEATRNRRHQNLA